ncbi:MAG: GT4 family glycosyltransferase PelF, partial [Candidatus Omnitrophica bacterium]|nr:GT4 family glycosyltransferase PelF [Candidatus Omnitrophota bacterium]
RTFSIIYLGPHRTGDKKMHYDLPENVVDYRELYIFDYLISRERTAPAGKNDFKAIEDFLVRLKRNEPSNFEEVFKIVGDERTRTVDLYDLAYSFESWRVLERLYVEKIPEPSFIDFFWTWRFMYLPFFSLLRSKLPIASLYHSVSTGYAGVLGVMAKLYYNRPFILTEHGIYTRERKIEIAHADWIYSETANEIKVVEGEEFFKEWWINLFSFYSKLAYENADEIITLYAGNRRIQIEEGAPPEKTRIIPNGIDMSVPRTADIDKPDKKIRIGFVGRVVPIKDVKTFIKACRIIGETVKDAEFYVIGPTDEDEDYYKECLALAENESLKELLTFTGKVDLTKYYPELDVVVLTSISEAQPIVVLEAGSYGIPVVATNVGACAELLYGSSTDDKLIGPSGIITPICNPSATAEAIMRIVKDRSLYKRMAAAGRRRISAYYQMDNLIAEYQGIYSHYMEEVRWPV